MQSSFTIHNKNYISFLILFSLIGVIFILISTSRYGAGLSPDSIQYISAATNFIDGKGIVNFSGEPLTRWPPMYPIILGAVSYIFNSRPLEIANTLNAIILGIIIYLSGMIFYRHTNSKLFLFIGVLVILITRSLINISIMAWSEPLFILFVLLFLLSIEFYLVKNKLIFLILLSTVVALASLTRYIGITLIVSGVIIILFLSKSCTKVKILHLFIFMFSAIIPLGIWIFRNYSICGRFFGFRSSSKLTLFNNIYLFVHGIYSWLVPGRILQYRLFFFGLISVMSIICLSIIIIILFKFTSKEDWQRLKSTFYQINSIIVFITIYIGFLLVSSSTTSYDAIDIRLLSPIYIPTILLLIIFTHWLTAIVIRYYPKKKVNGILFSIIFILLLPSISFTINDTMVYIKQGVYGFNTNLWQQSETINYLRNHKLESGYIIYSNIPSVLYILTNLKAQTSPLRVKYDNPNKVLKSLWDLKTTWAESSRAYLVWFKNKINRDLNEIEELEKIINFSKYKQFIDGTIYIIFKKN